MNALNKLFNYLSGFGLAFGIVTLPLTLDAAEERFSKRITGSSIAVPTVVLVKDGMYPRMTTNTTWNTLFVNHEVKNIVSLKVDPTRFYNQSAFSVTVTYKLDLTDAGQVVSNLSGSLTVDYDPAGGTTYKNIDVDLFSDGHVAELEITGVSYTGATVTPDMVALENEILVERYYLLKPYLSPDISSTAIDNELQLAWPKIEGAEYYEVQWTFIDNYDGSTSTLAASALDYDFRWDASVISTSENLARLPLVYDKGYIVYRARAVGRHLQNLDARVYSAWSLADNGTVSSAGTETYQVTNALAGDDFNWQAIHAFGPDGLRLTSVSYMDATLKQRQALTYDQETEQAIVSEGFYDYQGRMVISALPAPTGENTLDYYNDFNLNITDDPYSYLDFDLDDSENSCESVTIGMSDDIGASNYYSEDNPNLEGQQAYVADAQEFPFTQLEYTRDNTGRLRRTSGLGPVFQFGSGRETTIRYSTPDQEVLNYFFGNDAGWKESYTKTTTYDANGQASASYTDAEGRVVATSLLGDAPENLLALDETMTNETYETSLLSSQHDFLQTTKFTVEEAGEVDIDYRFTPQTYTNECIGELCLDCHYDLVLSLKDECGVEQLETEDQTHYIGATGEDLVCESMIEEFVETITVELAVGEYTMTKHLSLNDDYDDYYFEGYSNSNSCITGYDEFYADQLSTASVMPCDEGKCELFCLDELGPEEEFEGTAQEYYDLMQACLLECERPDPCEDFLQVLLADVTPGGQYAEYFDWTNNVVDPSVFPLSVLNTANQLGTGHHWRNPTTDYSDSEGAQSYIFVGGSALEPEHTNVFLHVFMENWQPSWAESLVEYHPEYCFYESCLANNESGSNEWDYYFNLTLKYDDALAAGYLNPLDANTGQGLPAGIGANTSNQDPFFFTTPGSAHYTDMINDMQGYFTIGGTTYTIWEAAIIQTFCEGVENDETEVNNCLAAAPTFASPGCDEEALWNTFKSLYQGLKQNYINEIAIQYSIENYCYNGCIGVAGFDEDANNFKTSGYYDPDQPCHSNTASLYENKVQRWQTYFEDAEVITIGDDCEDICEEKVEYWIMALAPCSMSQQEEDDVMEELLELCILGCDINNLNGSSTLPFPVTTTNGNASVHEVLEDHLGALYMSEDCSPWLISDPMPYDHTMSAGQSRLDECGCDRLLQNEYDFQNLGSPIVGVDDGYDYFAYLYGFPIPTYYSFLCRCEDIYMEEYEEPWEPNATWNSAAKEALLELNMPTIINFGCNKCFDCEAIMEAKSDVETLHDMVDTDPNYNLILTNYFNSTFMTNMSTTELLYFIAQCEEADAATNDEWCSELSPGAQELEDALNWLITYETLLSTEASATNLMGLPGFSLTSLANKTIGHSFWASAATTSSSTQGQFNIGIVTNDDVLVECQLSLDISPTALPGWCNFGTLVSVENMTYDAPANGVNYDFLLDGNFDNGTSQHTQSISGTSTCYPIRTCFILEELELCTPEFQGLGDESISDCLKQQIQNAEFYASEAYSEYLAGVEAEFHEEYTEKCSLAIETEKFTRESAFKEHHFTLYYYDKAGNLLKTIPPKGVDGVDIPTLSDDVDDSRLLNGTPVLPTHTMATQYRYNSRNQVVLTKSPDGGETRFWYDHSGRLIYSQNAVQSAASPKQYSYTIYDDYSRVIEVGQVATNTSPNGYVTDMDDVWTFVTSGARSQLTRTFYDACLHPNIDALFDNGQENVRNRVVTTATYYNYGSALEYDNAYHYSYDEHGNVKEIVFDVPRLADYSQRYKHTKYDFNHLSGNMEVVSYQDGSADAYYHRYFYDANNRLKSVETSKDKIIWDQEAKYFYYDHGPLARIEYGDQKVHAQDYFYTLQGWLKGVNSNALYTSRDPGNDGTLGYLSDFNKIHKTVAADAYGYSLSYFEDDYEAILAMSTTEDPIADLASSALDAAAPGLYNGNIRHMVTSIGGLDAPVQATAYNYDQLHRLKTMEAFQNISESGNTWGATSALTDYEESYNYDANGNIEELVRNGVSTTQTDMDNFVYNYTSGTNKLNYVHDNVLTSAGYDDIKTGQITGNYTYNAIGQLTGDVSEEISNIQWNIYGKVREMTIGTTWPTYIRFEYDAFGNRIMKRVEHGGSSSNNNVTSTFYTHDAGGKVVAIYDHTYEEAPGGDYEYNASLAEVPLYGSKRVGSFDWNKLLHMEQKVGATTTNTNYAADPVAQERGMKQYELSNHLGNVLATVSDIKVEDEDQELMNDDYASSSAQGWVPTSVNCTLSVGSSPDRLVATTGVQFEGVEKTITTVVGEIYSVVLDLDIGTLGNLGYGAYESGTANDLFYATTTTSGQKFFTFVATTTSTDIKVISNSTGSGTFYVNSATMHSMQFAADYRMMSDYYPFGMPMPGRQNTASSYRYGLNGMEKDNEIKGDGISYTTQFRQYDPRLGRWLSIDPMAKLRSWLSPYNFVQNNPNTRIDKTGALDNPIYDRNGWFLGTDDRGLKGKAIVMDRKDFRQGMSHKEAAQKNLGSSGLKGQEAAQRLSKHYSGLKFRPDYDGVITRKEANEWYRGGYGQPLYVDASKISLSPVYKGELKVGEHYINYASFGKANPSTGGVYGTIKLTVLDERRVLLGRADGFLDEYDFERHDGRYARNVNTWIGKQSAGTGIDFKIYNYGEAILKDRPAPNPYWGPKF